MNEIRPCFKPLKTLRPFSHNDSGVIIYNVGPEARAGDLRLITCCRLNHTTAEVWVLCGGKHTISEIVRVIAGRYRIDPEAVKLDVYEILGDLQARGYVELNHESFF